MAYEIIGHNKHKIPQYITTKTLRQRLEFFSKNKQELLR